jgi:hypothetical protein
MASSLLISTLNEVEILMGWSRQLGQVAGAVIEADANNQLTARWDNTPHFPDLPGFPDHMHDGVTGEVTPGQPMSIFTVLDEIAGKS